MKKLMIMAAVAMAAVASQAAYFGWGTGKGGLVYLPETETTLSSGMAYIFAGTTTGEGATMAYKTIIDAFVADTLDLSSGSLDNSAVSAGKITPATTSDNAFDYGAKGDTTQFYFALLATDGEGNKMLYISPEATGAGQDGTKVTGLSFSAAASSKAKAFDAADGYQGAGWYTAVPEPTSGLLLLLGVAGLALRRRRA